MSEIETYLYFAYILCIGDENERVAGSGGATRPARGFATPAPLSPSGEEIENDLQN